MKRHSLRQPTALDLDWLIVVVGCLILIVWHTVSEQCGMTFGLPPPQEMEGGKRRGRGDARGGREGSPTVGAEKAEALALIDAQREVIDGNLFFLRASPQTTKCAIGPGAKSALRYSRCARCVRRCV